MDIRLGVMPEQCVDIKGMHALKVGLQLGFQVHSLCGETDVVLALESELIDKTEKTF